MKKFWTIFLNTILIIFVLIGILVVFSLLPLKNNYRIFSVMSGSMEPTLPVGSLIVVKPVGEYKVSDVITYKSTAKKNDFTTHRIHEIKDKDGTKTFVTKGDANEEPDFESVGLDRVIGKQRFTIALVGYVLWFVKTLPGLIIIIVIPALILIYDEVDKIKKEFKNIKKARKKKAKGTNDKNKKA